MQWKWNFFHTSKSQKIYNCLFLFRHGLKEVPCERKQVFRFEAEALTFQISAFNLQKYFLMKGLII